MHNLKSKKMYFSLLVGLLLSTLSLLVVAQEYSDDKKPPGYDEQPGYGPKYHPPGYNNKHGTGYNRPRPYHGYQYGKGYYHHRQPHLNYRPHDGYAYDPYEYCKPDYDSYSVYDKEHMRYLESADEHSLNKNDSLFESHKTNSYAKAEPLCEEGPKHIPHTVHYEWHWPPIYKGSCDDLEGCKYSRCIAKKTVKKTACVLVFRNYGYRWVRIGYRKITFKSDVECKCRECRDIKSYRECVNTHPCPDKGDKYSYCFWKRPYKKVDPYDHKDQYDHKDSYDHKDPKNGHENTYKDPHDEYRDKRSAENEFADSEYNDEEINELDPSLRFTRSTDDYDKKEYETDKKGYGADPYDDRGYKTDPYYTYGHLIPPGHCDCCYPQLCIPPMRFDYDLCKCVCPKKKCLPGHTFNPYTCKCECPKGTYLDKKKQKCVGICKLLDTKSCENVLCKDNPHFYCQLDKNYKCRCPSCDDVDLWQKDLCKNTKCIEDGYKPYCVFDWRNGQCRCPECEDQKSQKECEKTTCRDPYKTKKKCKWVWYPYPACKCPKYDSSEHKKPGYSHAPGYDGDKKTDK